MSDSDCSYVEEGEDFEERFTELKLQWKNALKKAKKLLLKCPNYERCQFKCGSVGGMQYHYVRCTGKSPKFKCDHCPRKYESRTGLNYHMASNHGATPVEEIKSDGRPQRMTALSTMSAIIIANNPPPLKHIVYKIPPSKTTPTPSNRPLHNEPPTRQQTVEPILELKVLNMEQKMETEALLNLEPNVELLEPKIDRRSGIDARTKVNLRNVENPKVKIPRTVPVVPVVMAESGEEEDMGGGEGEEEEGDCDKNGGWDGEEKGSIEGEVRDEVDGNAEGGEDGREEGGENDGMGKGRGRKRASKDKKGGKAVNIPSIEYPDEYKYFLPSWRQEMKDNKVIKCPNYEECEFKCTTVNGMKYHYVRCMKTNPPEFNCEVCGKKFQCRTGLVWHLKKTHMLVEMHPSKEGGFRGIIEADGTRSLSFLGQVSTRKRGKLDDGLKRRSSGAGRKASGNGKKEWPGGRLRRRRRKCNFPRRTADEILQNIVNIEILPEPKLAPESHYSNLPCCEYVVVDRIPTDVNSKASTVITLGEDALQWQQMYSNDSDTDNEDEEEDDYLTEVDGVGGEAEVGGGGYGKPEEEEGAFDNYFSHSSSSDSDEDYTVPYQRKRRGGKTSETRGRGRRGRGAEIKVASSHTHPPPSSLTRPMAVSHVDSSADIKTLATNFLPPPPLVSTQCPPFLIKAQQDSISPRLGRNFYHGPSRGRGSSSNTHIQPPPALIMPEMCVVKSENSLLKPKIPPLMRKQVEPIETQQLQKTIRIVKAHPQIVIPSPNMVGVGGESLSPGGIISVPRNIPPTPPLAPVKRRPGRPKKDHSVVVNANLPPQKTLHTINVSQGRGGRGGRGRGAGVVQPGRASCRSVRARPFDFQSLQEQHQAPVTVNQGVYLAQPNHTATTSPSSSSAGTPSQFQSLILQSPTNSTVHSNIITPLQIVPAVQANTNPVQVQTFSTVPQGGLIYLQGVAPQQTQDPSPTYVTKGNQMYQILTPTASAGRPAAMGDGTKKISVIMQSPTGCQATYVQRGDVGGYQYVTQLDGPQPPVSCDRGVQRGEVRGYQYVTQLDGPQPPVSCDRGVQRGEVGGYQYVTQLDGPQPPVSCDRGVQRGEVGGYQYVTQLDGPQPPVSCDRGDGVELRRKFERARQKVAILQLDGPPPPAPKTCGKLSCDSSVKSCDRKLKSCEKGSEGKMSDQLKSYLDREEVHQCAPACATLDMSKHLSKSVDNGSGHRTSRRGKKSPSCAAEDREQSKHLSKSVDNGSGHRTSRRRKKSPSCAAEDREQSLPTAKRNCRGGSPLSPPLPSACSVRTRGRGLKGRGRGRRKNEAIEEAESCSLLISVDSSLTGDDEGCVPTTSGDGSCGIRDTGQSVSELSHCSQSDQMCSSECKITKHTTLSVEDDLNVCISVWRQMFKRQRSVKCHLCRTHEANSVQSMRYHWSKCGKSITLICDKCGKTYTTKAGLSYHLRHAHAERISCTSREEEERPSSPSSTFESPNGNQSVPLRRAAVRASRKISKLALGDEGRTGEGLARVSGEMTAMGEGGEDRVGEEARVDYAVLREQLKEAGEVTCPHEDCGRMFRTIQGLRYHLKTYHMRSRRKREDSVGVGGCEVTVMGAGCEDRVDSSALRKQFKKTGKVACPQEDCDYVFRTIQGLRYHLNTYHMRSRKKREDSVGAGGCEVTVMGEGCEDGVDTSALRKQFKKAGEVACPQADCDKIFRSISGLLYHLRNYHTGEGGKGMGQTKYLCPFCRTVLKGKKRIEKHFIAKHPDNIDDIENLEEMKYIPVSSLTNEDLSSNSGEEMGDQKAEMEERLVKKKTSSASSKRVSLNMEDAHGYEIKLPKTHQQFCEEVREYLEAVYDKERSLLSKEEWKPRLEDWHLVRDSSSFLPVQTRSMLFRIATAPCKESDPSFSSPSSSLLLFQALSTPANKGAVFFTGGPVWAMDWLPRAPSHHQHLALAAYRELDETHPLTSAISCEGAIQLWNLGLLENHSKGESSSLPLPRLSFVIAHDYGPIRCLRWYHSGFSRCSQSDNREKSRSHDISSEEELLGMLAVACGDGCIRLLSIPNRSHFRFSSCSPEPIVVQQSCVSGLLVPVGVRRADWSEFGQCLCLDWSPGNKFNKIAAGFSNGSVCVWDLKSKLFRSSCPSSTSFPSCHEMFHPVMQFSAHKHMPCRCVAWCPQDLNYLFTGGLDKMDNLWDIRQPFSPVDKQERGLPVHSTWTQLWPNCMVARDNMRFNPLNTTMGVSYKYYTHPLPLHSKTITASSAPLSGLSYSMWTDRAAAISFAGELNVVTFPTSFHNTICHQKRQKQEFLNHHHKLVFGCHLESRVEGDMEVGGCVQTDTSSCNKRATSVCGRGRPQSMKELSVTHRLVMTPHENEVEEGLYHFPVDGTPLAALTQVCWSPNEESGEWLVVGTNCGLVCLLSLPPPATKPFSLFRSSSANKPSLASKPSL